MIMHFNQSFSGFNQCSDINVQNLELRSFEIILKTLMSNH